MTPPCGYVRPSANLRAECWLSIGSIPVTILPPLHNGHWEVPPFPDGDYYIFLSEDFRDGWFGHPWEQTVCIFGQRAVSSLGMGLPKLFINPIRQRIYPPS